MDRRLLLQAGYKIAGKECKMQIITLIHCLFYVVKRPWVRKSMPIFPVFFFSCASPRCLSDHRHRYVASGIVIRKVEMLSNRESSKDYLK